MSGWRGPIYPPKGPKEVQKAVFVSLAQPFAKAELALWRPACERCWWPVPQTVWTVTLATSGLVPPIQIVWGSLRSQYSHLMRTDYEQW